MISPLKRSMLSMMTTFAPVLLISDSIASSTKSSCLFTSLGAETHGSISDHMKLGENWCGEKMTGSSGSGS